MTRRNKTLPRPFKFKGIGKGEIREEAKAEYKTWAATIQLLKFDNKNEMLRFCYYTESGKLAPRALSINDEDVDKLRDDIKKNPQVKKFLQRLLA